MSFKFLCPSYETEWEQQWFYCLQDLKKVMDIASNGVIYFSMGSNLKSKEMPDKLKKKLIKMFSDLKYTVLWKFEEEFFDLPENVHTVKWAPQHSILGKVIL